MKTFVDCVPCLMRQAVAAPRRFTGDEELVAEVVRRAARAVADFDMTRTPPEMGSVLNEIMAQVLGVPDLYYEEKRRLNREALAVLPRLRELVRESDDPFRAAVRLSIAANIMDFGAPGGRTDGDLAEVFEEALSAPIVAEDEAVARFSRAVEGAERILFLADNSGEIVVDRILLEMLPAGKVTVAVRSGPAINDALLEDAREAGISEVAQLIESGVALPGTPLERASDELRELFAGADVIISKGQGNYETLNERPEPVFFLLMAKCDLVARQLGCRVGDRLLVTPRG